MAEGSDDQVAGRDLARVALSLAIVFGVVLAAALVPAVQGSDQPSVPGPLQQSGDGATGTGPESNGGGAGEGLAGSGGGEGDGGADGGRGEGEPTGAGSNSAESTGAGGRTPSGSGGGLGALSPGDQTTVGGVDAAGGFGPASQRVHFEVQAPQPSYWRTGAFDQYTGEGWRSTARDRPYDGGRVARGVERREQFVQRVTLQRSATSLPAAWRPVALAGTEEDVRVTEFGSFRGESAVPANTTYRVLSSEPVREPARLRAAGDSYPREVEERYTRLSTDTDRLASFTAEVTADADSPYETAVAVESWLEANKEYSLNASRDGGDAASQFVFEMDRGYCQHFATAMTVMLRTQDVPARYVVGYSTGQPVGDRYVVRGMNAHAWVEVYFADVGWVRFDPTPGSERLSAEGQAFAQGSPGGSDGQSGSAGPEGSSGSGGESASESGERSVSGDAGSYAHSERGSPGESFSAGGGQSDDRDGSDGSGASGRPDDTGESDESDDSSESDESDDTGESDDPEEGPTYAFELNQSTLIPGTDVVVTVTRDDEPASGMTVLFDGEPVGTTDPAGRVVGTVPYRSQLNVSVRTETTRSLVHPGQSAGLLFDVRLPAPAALREQAGGTGVAADRTDTYVVATNATVDISSTPLPGEAVRLHATVRDQPVPDARVRLNGTTVGRTGENGTVQVTLPTDRRQVRFEVGRGDVTGALTLSLVTDLTVSVSEPTVPTGDVIVRVGADGGGISNASVTAGNRSLGRTNDSGAAAVTLPDVGGNVTVTATRGVARGNTTVQLERLTVDATPAGPFSVAWTDLRVRAELAGEPTSNVEVRLNGQRVGQTGENGTLRATLPPTTRAMVVARGHSQTARADGGSPLLGLGGILAVLAGGLVVAWRRGPSARGTARGVTTVAVRAARRVVAGVVTVAGWLDSAIGRLLAGLARLREDVSALPAILRAGAEAVRDRVRAVVWRLQGTVTGVRDRVAAVVRRTLALRDEDLRSLALAAVAWLRGRLFGSASRESDGTEARPTPARSGGDAVADDERARLTVREAWREFVGHASVRRPGTMTPGEVARRAIERDDLPPDAVATLRDAFRDVEYGSRSPDDYLDGAHEALDSIRGADERAARRND